LARERQGPWILKPPPFAALTERIKINAVSREVRDGRVFWMKRRRAFARPVLASANLFFRIARAPLQTIPDPAAWQRWEVACFLGLHGEHLHAFAEGPRTVGTEEMPGSNLTVPLDCDALTPAMAAAAGRELRRAHAWHCPALRGKWSHGDAHIGNFIYDPARDEARIIDFEVAHDAALSADARHADDVLVFLQDMVGRISAERWLPCARAFLRGYGRPEIAALVAPQLSVPRGFFARLWWRVRTGFLPRAELDRRLTALRPDLGG
jgi:hypothetical protein